jgi:hypothetical protein
VVFGKIGKIAFFLKARLADPNKIAVFGGLMPDFVRTYWVKFWKIRPNILSGPESGLVTYYRGSLTN